MEKIIISILATLIIAMIGGCGSGSDFEEIHGFSPDKVPEPLVTDVYSTDGIDITLYSQQGIVDQLGVYYTTEQFIDFGDSIEQFVVDYSVRYQPLDEMAVPNIREYRVKEIGNKKFKIIKPVMAYHYNSVSLYYPLDDEHFLYILAANVNSYDKEGNLKPALQDIMELIDNPSFEKAIVFEVEGTGEMTKDYLATTDTEDLDVTEVGNIKESKEEEDIVEK